MTIDEPQFTSSDVAELVGEPEGRIRHWHHCGFNRFFGAKDGYAVRYSTRDIAGFAVARDLVRMAFPTPLAARIGAIVMHRAPESDAVLTGTPEQIAMITPPPGSGIPMDRTSWRVPGPSTSTVSIPVGDIWADISARAAKRGGL
ncbi:hypothetical protein [Devosia riboflavina]